MNAADPRRPGAAEGPGATDARAVILARLRGALADAPAAEPVPRDYGLHLPAGTDLVALFTDRLVDYKATVHQSVAPALAGVARLLVPVDTPASWLAGFDGEVVVDDGLPLSTVDSVDAVLTGCAVAVAETGTIILDGGIGQGRRAATLVPDRHIVLVDPAQIVGRVPEAVRRLAETSARRPQTWISGPSATSDIELIRVEGVHGPRHLDVVIAALPAAG